ARFERQVTSVQTRSGETRVKHGGIGALACQREPRRFSNRRPRNRQSTETGRIIYTILTSRMSNISNRLLYYIRYFLFRVIQMNDATPEITKYDNDRH